MNDFYKPYEERIIGEQYKNLIREILANGTWSPSPMVDEHGEEIRTLDLMGASTIRFKMEDGAPIITERDISGFYKSAIGELFAFINGAHTQEELAAFGCKWWKAWVTPTKCAKRGLEAGDLGPGSYGCAFANFPTADGGSFNQFTEIIKQMQERPELKTHIISPWIPQYTIRNSDNTQKVVVAPCHGWLHFRIFDDKLTMLLWQRSSDVLIGLPSNWAQYSALLMAMADVLGLQPYEFIHQISDAHIYENQMDYVDEILNRPSNAYPTLKLVKSHPRITDYRREDFELSDYHAGEKIKGIPVGI